MRRIAAAVVGTMLTTLLTPAPASAVDVERILLLGDSVTHGSDGDYTWRSFSWQGLQETGATVDFVGPRQGTYGGDGRIWDGGYADPGFDTDHASRWGLSMFETLYYPDPEVAPTIETLVAEHDPDVVVETLGVNDFVWINRSADDMQEQVRQFVARARAAKPDLDIVLGTIPQTWIAQVPAYNAALPGLAAELTTPESRVVAAPVADFTAGVDTYDGAHPTTAGQVKIAAAVSEALADLGIGSPIVMPLPDTPGPNDPARPAPEPPVEPPPAVIAPPAGIDVPGTAVEQVRPSAPRRVRAVRRDAHVRVAWRTVQDAARYDVRCGDRRRQVRTTRVALRTAAARCRVRAVNASGASSWRVVRIRTGRAAAMVHTTRARLLGPE